MKKDSMKNEPELNDLQIAHIAYTAGNIDIRYAHLALALSEELLSNLVSEGLFTRRPDRSSFPRLHQQTVSPG